MDKINIELVEQGLKNQIVGQKILFYHEISSTSLIAKELARAGEKHGTVVLAEAQSGGTGRQGRKWMSPPGVGIWMSVILRSDMSVEDAAKLPALLSLAVRKALQESTGLQVLIKWPNDIVINKKKVCGILTESIVEGSRVSAVIVGIGVNVNQGRDYFLDLPHASSLRIETGCGLYREEIMQNILYHLENYYNNFMKTKTTDINEIKNFSAIFGKKVRVIHGDNELIGNVEDFLEDGSIVIEDNTGKTVNISSSNVSIRGLNSYID